jgi:hypothetical protein
MQDELSAMARLEFNNLKELFNEGIRPDGHPAFVQLFLYFWTKLFGYSELVVKLPSMLCGLGSIWLSFRLSKKFFDGHIGLIVVALIALSQYYVMYFSLARPYAYGTFFVLGQIYSLVQWREKGMKPYALTFVLFSILSAYTHYFCMLVAGLVTLWGFIWLKKNQFKFFILSIILCVLLFLPHLPISMHQLSLGGIGGEAGWLNAPESDFTQKYFSYLSQYHVAGLLLFCAAGLSTFLRLPRMNSDQGRFIILGFGLMFIPLLIGYQYSIRVNPVIQFSALIFGSIPFLIALFSGLKFFGAKVKTFLVILTISITAYGLIIGRAHYEITEFQPYDELADAAENTSQNIMLMADMNEAFIAQYDHNRELNYEYIQIEEQSLQEIKSELSKDGPALIHVDRMAEILPMVLDEFESKACLIQRPTYDLVRLNSEIPEARCHLPHLTMRGPLLDRSYGEEYGSAFETNLNEVKGYPFITLTVSQEIHSLEMTEGTLVSEIWHEDSLVHWLGRDVSKYSVADDTGLTTYLSIRVQDVVKNEFFSEQLKWKVYYWNRSQEAIIGDSLNVRILIDRATRYGLIEDF